MLLKTLAFVFVLNATGCVIPEETKVTGGHKYSKGSLAFLDLPGTTREEVIASLGPPLLESRDSRTLLYAWETTSRWVSVYPEAHFRHPREWGLFIAYDERGFVSAHEVRRVGVDTLEEACSEWSHDRNEKH